MSLFIYYYYLQITLKDTTTTPNTQMMNTPYNTIVQIYFKSSAPPFLQCIPTNWVTTNSILPIYFSQITRIQLSKIVQSDNSMYLLVTRSVRRPVHTNNIFKKKIFLICICSVIAPFAHYSTIFRALRTEQLPARCRPNNPTQRAEQPASKCPPPKVAV